MSQPVIDHDTDILKRFVGIYCRKQHGSAPDDLCPECRDLLTYAEERRERCPLDPKPSCKSCPIHCYRPEMRTRIRRVMAFSGRYMALRRGRLDWLVKYFLWEPLKLKLRQHYSLSPSGRKGWG